MRIVISMFLVSACLLTGCDKTKSSSASAPENAGGATASDDPVQKKLQELAGGGATNCGFLKSQGRPELDAASKCAMDAAKAKTPFYVVYQMPGMNVALAGNAQGRLYTVQSQEAGAGLASSDCPAELRVAPSGRVTCYAPGTFPMGAGAGSHTNMTVPPFMGTGSKHGATGAMPAGHPAVQAKPKPQPPAQ